MKAMRYFLSVLAGTALTAAETPNLLKNPGFEERNNWQSWGTIAQMNGGKVMEYSAEKPFAGKSCLKIIDSWDCARPYVIQFVSMPAKRPGDAVLRLTFRARAPQSHRFRAGMLYDPVGKYHCEGGAWSNFTATTEWQTFSMDFPAVPDKANQPCVCFGATTDAMPEIGEIYIDDVKLEFVRSNPADKLGIDLPVQNQRNYPRTPKKGAVETVNPPAFIWRPPLNWQKGKYTYTLEYSQDKDFKTGVRRVTGLARHVEVPQETLASGQWYWRFGVENQPGGTIWSEVWDFTVSPQASADPFPKMADAMARIPKGHPRLYVTPETLPELRRRAKDGDLKGVAERIIAHFDRRDFYHQKLTPEPPFLPKEREARIKEFVRIMRETRSTQWQMESAAFAYLLTGDKKIGNEARRRVLYFFSWDPDGSTALTHNDEPAMWIMRWGVCSYDWTYDLYTPEEHRIIQKSLARRARQNWDVLTNMPFDSCPYSSHPNGYLQILGEAGIELAGIAPDAEKYVEYATKCFRAFCPTYGQPDGGWNEGPGYWSYTQERNMRFVFEVKAATGIDLGKKPFFQNTGFYPLLGWPAKSRLTCFADEVNPVGQAQTLAICAAYTGNADFLLPLREFGRQPNDSIVYRYTDASQLGEPHPERLPLASCFPYIGFVVMRNDYVHYPQDIGLIFECSPFGNASHRHNAQNAFQLEAYTEPLLISSGYYDAYGSKHHTQWTWETRSHCAITYNDGKGQIRGGAAAGKITEFRHDKDFDAATGDAVNAYPGATMAKRTIVHVRPGIYVIRDRYAAKEARTWEFNLHSINPGTFDETAQSVTFTMPKAGLLVKFFHHAPLKFSTVTNPYSIDNGKRYRERWHFRAALAALEKALDLITVLMPYPAGKADTLPQVEKLSDGVKFIWKDGKTRTVRFGGNGVMTEKDR